MNASEKPRIQETVALTEKGLLIAILARVLGRHGCPCDACKIAQETIDKMFDDTDSLVSLA